MPKCQQENKGGRLSIAATLVQPQPPPKHTHTHTLSVGHLLPTLPTFPTHLYLYIFPSPSRLMSSLVKRLLRSRGYARSGWSPGTSTRLIPGTQAAATTNDSTTDSRHSQQPAAAVVVAPGLAPHASHCQHRLAHQAHNSVVTTRMYCEVICSEYCSCVHPLSTQCIQLYSMCCTSNT
jgi:hypothetical protein